MKYDKAICMWIARAQAASDGGKHREITRWDINTPSDCLIIPGCKLPGEYAKLIKCYNPYWWKDYDIKDVCLLKAISLITKSKNSKFRFSVSTTDCDYDNQAIIYFQYKDGDTRYQVSFHTMKRKKFEKYLKNKSHYIRWDKKNSRESVFKLLEIFYQDN